jgi:hypothetical protein
MDSVQNFVLRINSLLTDILGASDEIIYPEITQEEQNERYESQSKVDQERRVVSKALSPYIESTISFLRTTGLYRFNSTINPLDIQIDNSKVLTESDWKNLVENLKEENGDEWIFIAAQMHNLKLSEMLEVPSIMEDFKFSLDVQLAAYQKLFETSDLAKVYKDIDANERDLSNGEGNVLAIINKYFKVRPDFIISYLLYRKRYRLEIEMLIKLQALVQSLENKQIRKLLKYFDFGNGSDAPKEF